MVADTVKIGDAEQVFGPVPVLNCIKNSIRQHITMSLSELIKSLVKLSVNAYVVIKEAFKTVLGLSFSWLRNNLLSRVS